MLFLACVLQILGFAAKVRIVHLQNHFVVGNTEPQRFFLQFNFNLTVSHGRIVRYIA
ncbi:hypothetical protein SAMN06265379_101768 [Saccharicrinis carchari]|uniref:Uncharacterized protein n=1 Tax=Saccharicrinis carchari TaxID=1168039 RepID=A0A521B7G6_SACCC|nr:hypothetical protein SAMN06265379_101768 [Saccharicrinis carchari]